MKAPSLEDVTIAVIVATLTIVLLTFIGWAAYCGLSTRQEQHSCRDRGGTVVHLDGPHDDWRCEDREPDPIVGQGKEGKGGDGSASAGE